MSLYWEHWQESDNVLDLLHRHTKKYVTNSLSHLSGFIIKELIPKVHSHNKFLLLSPLGVLICRKIAVSPNCLWWLSSLRYHKNIRLVMNLQFIAPVCFVDAYFFMFLQINKTPYSNFNFVSGQLEWIFAAKHLK